MLLLRRYNLELWMVTENTGDDVKVVKKVSLCPMWRKVTKTERFSRNLARFLQEMFFQEYNVLFQ